MKCLCRFILEWPCPANTKLLRNSRPLWLPLDYVFPSGLRSSQTFFRDFPSFADELIEDPNLNGIHPHSRIGNNIERYLDERN